jgi:hypothetical protein
MLASQRHGSSNRHVNARGKSVQIIIRSAANNTRVIRVFAVQALEIPAIKGEHRATRRGGVSEHLGIRALGTSGFLHGKHIMSYLAQAFHQAGAKILISIKQGHPPSTIGVLPDVFRDFVGMRSRIFPSRLQVGKSEGWVPFQDDGIGLAQPSPFA